MIDHHCWLAWLRSWSYVYSIWEFSYMRICFLQWHLHKTSFYEGHTKLISQQVSKFFRSRLDRLDAWDWIIFSSIWSSSTEKSSEKFSSEFSSSKFKIFIIWSRRLIRSLVRSITFIESRFSLKSDNSILLCVVLSLERHLLLMLEFSISKFEFSNLSSSCVQKSSSLLSLFSLN